MAPRRVKPRQTDVEDVIVEDKGDQTFIHYIKWFIKHNPFLVGALVIILISCFSSCGSSSSKEVEELKYKVEKLKERVDKLEQNRSSSGANPDTW